MTETKTCSKCGEVKAVEMYPVRGLTCKACVNLVARLARAGNPGRYAAADKNRREANREKIVASRKKHRAANREKLAAFDRKYLTENREKVYAARKKYRDANPIKFAEICKKWKDANREKILADRKTETALLTNSYVKQLVSQRLGIPAIAIPVELIEAKRTHLQILRKIKELTNER